MMAIERQLSMGYEQGGGPGAVVKAACLENQRSRVSSPAGIQVSKKQNVTSSLTCKYLISWGASVTSVLGLRPSELECRVRCLEGSVTSFISLFSGGSQAQLSIYVHTDGLNPQLFIFMGHEKKTENVYDDKLLKLRLISDEVPTPSRSLHYLVAKNEML